MKEAPPSGGAPFQPTLSVIIHRPLALSQEIGAEVEFHQEGVVSACVGLSVKIVLGKAGNPFSAVVGKKGNNINYRC
jgi:hypothetical protein